MSDTACEDWERSAKTFLPAEDFEAVKSLAVAFAQDRKAGIDSSFKSASARHFAPYTPEIPALLTSRLLDALTDLSDAFLSRHGCFPLDETTPEQRKWKAAMKKARDTLAIAALSNSERTDG